MGWTLEQILAATGGRLQGGAKARRFGEVVTDSNQVKKDAVFVALKGEKFDGHCFVGDAAHRGAACVIVHKMPRSVPRQKTVTVVRVADTLRALGDLAHFRRQQLGVKVLAMTGSNGKTTTKEMLAAIVQHGSLDGESLRGRVVKTEGNFNNLVGLPLTLLRLRKKHRVAVVEMGTNRPGEIARLARIAEPDLGLITSVAAAHLEGLNSLAGVAREKGALFANVRPDGAIVVNLDDPWVRRLGARSRLKKVTYGRGGQVQAGSGTALGSGAMRFDLRVGGRRQPVRLRFLGSHNIANALGAAAMAHALGIDAAAIRRGLESVKPYAMRMQLERWRGVGIINDAYNANPASMAAAIATLEGVACRGQRIAVLGDMFELGQQSRRQHRQLGAELGRARIDRAYLLGERAEDVRSGALRSGVDADWIVVARSHADIARRLRGHLKSGDWILLKGSRGMKMESILAHLKSSGRRE